MLANAIGLEVVHSEVIALAKLRAGSYFGKGVTKRLGDLAKDFTHDCRKSRSEGVFGMFALQTFFFSMVTPCARKSCADRSGKVPENDRVF